MDISRARDGTPHAMRPGMRGFRVQGFIVDLRLAGLCSVGLDTERMVAERLSCSFRRWKREESREGVRAYILHVIWILFSRLLLTRISTLLIVVWLTSLIKILHSHFSPTKFLDHIH